MSHRRFVIVMSHYGPARPRTGRLRAALARWLVRRRRTRAAAWGGPAGV